MIHDSVEHDWLQDVTVTPVRPQGANDNWTWEAGMTRGLSGNPPVWWGAAYEKRATFTKGHIQGGAPYHKNAIKSDNGIHEKILTP